MIKTTIRNPRKRRRAASRGLILLFCVGFAIADSSLAKSGIPPPPPPPPIVSRQDGAISSQKTFKSVAVKQEANKLPAAQKHNDPPRKVQPPPPPPPPPRNLARNNLKGDKAKPAQLPLEKEELKFNAEPGSDDEARADDVPLEVEKKGKANAWVHTPKDEQNRTEKRALGHADSASTVVPNFGASQTKQMYIPPVRKSTQQPRFQPPELQQLSQVTQYETPQLQPQGYSGQPPGQPQRRISHYRSQPQHQRMYQSSQIRSTNIMPTWKSLWGSVEKGLDSLADIEGVLTGKARKVVSSVTTGPLAHAHHQNQAPKQMRDWQQVPDQSRSMPRSRYPTKQKYTQYGQKQIEVTKDNKKRDQATASVIVRQIDWNDLTSRRKMIRANGGASAPNGQTPVPPVALETSATSSNPPLSPQRQSSLSTPTGSNAPPETQLSLSSQSAANPYVKASQVPDMSRKAADPHSRASRIPWDTSTQPRQLTPVSTKKTLPLEYDEDQSWKSRLSKLVPTLPRIPSPIKLLRLRRDKSYHYAGMEAWKDDEESEKKKGRFSLFRRGSNSSKQFSPQAIDSDIEIWAPPLASMMARCESGKTPSLLSHRDQKECRNIGRRQAIFDAVCVIFLLGGTQQIADISTLSFPDSFSELISKTLPLSTPLLRDSLKTWAPFFFVYAYLTIVTKKVFLQPKISALASSIAASVQDECQYAQLYLRLVSAIPMDPKLPGRLMEAATSQVSSLISKSHLYSFITMLLSLLLVMTASIIRPFVTAIATSLSQVIFLEHWRSWPIEWGELGATVKDVFQSLYLRLESLVASGLTSILENPMHFAFHLAFFGSLLVTTLLPRLEEKRRIKSEDNVEVVLSPLQSGEQLSRLGTSSASRLSLLSENGSVENALERVRITQIPPVEEYEGISFSKLSRRVGYALLLSVLSIAPVMVSFFVGEASINTFASTILRWDSVLDVSVIFFFVFLLANTAMKDTIESTERRPPAQGFLTTLSKTLEEIQASNRKETDIQFMTSVSPTAGLLVKDLWAAHTMKRAWAVRGVNLQCRNGEVLALLGDDGAGKTRLLTAIAESLIAPPKRALTSNKVRGLISIGGVEGSKWSVGLLKRRLGIFLSDIRTVADAASLFSGWTMEEILEPVDGLRTIDPSHKLSSSERSSIISALKVCVVVVVVVVVEQLLFRWFCPNKIACVCFGRSPAYIPPFSQSFRRNCQRSSLPTKKIYARLH